MSLRRNAAYSFEMSVFSTAGGTDAGSATYAARSANAIRFASTSAWRYAGDCYPIDCRSNPSRMFNISSNAMPPELGGGMDKTWQPR